MRPRARRLVGYAVACAALGAVFALYTRPEIIVTLSEQIWACFGR